MESQPKPLLATIAEVDPTHIVFFVHRLLIGKDHIPRDIAGSSRSTPLLRCKLPSTSPYPTPSRNKRNIIPSWWFQPIWKILVKLEIFPQVGVNIKNIWNHHLDIQLLVE